MARNDEFDELLTEQGAIHGEWLGVAVIDSFGDEDAEYAAVGNGLAISDRSSRGTVVADGTEVVELLQGVVTSDVFELAEPGSGQRSAAVNAKGRMICDLRLLHGPEILIMDFEPGLVEGGVISHFRANVMMEDAKFTDRTTSTSRVGVFGPDAARTISELADLQASVAGLQMYCGTWGTIAGHDVVVQRIALTGGPGFDLLFATDAATDVWNLFIEQGATPVGERALETLRVEAGVPRWGAELDEKIIPLEAGFDDAISFHKGCYVGQEIIARLDTLGTPAKMLRTLVFDDGELPAPGDRVFAGEKKAGEVRSVVYSPRIDRGVALAYVKRAHNEPGNRVRAADAEAVVQPLEPVTTITPLAHSAHN